MDVRGEAGVSSKFINVAVVDDHPAIAAALEAAIRAEAADSPAGATKGSPALLRIVGTARRAEDAISIVARIGPDAPAVVICDIQLEQGLDGLEVIEAARAAGIASIVLTAFDRSSLMRAAFERGASGFLDKGAEMTEILRAIRVVASGGTAFSAATLDAARRAPRPPSAREVAVLTGLQRGATSEEIGARLGISTRTVESHLRRLFDRYGVVSRTELAVLAVEEGWVEASRQ